MGTKAPGAVADRPADCDALITPALFWLLLTTLAAVFVFGLAVAIA